MLMLLMKNNFRFLKYFVKNAQKELMTHLTLIGSKNLFLEDLIFEEINCRIQSLKFFG